MRERGGKPDENVKSREEYDVEPPHLSGDNEPSDDDIEAQEVASFVDRLSVESNLEPKLDDVNIALKRIEGGEYGKCDNCNTSTISKERLEVLPSARVCMDCEQKDAK